MFVLGIRQLQCILLKIALVLGVEIYQNVKFIDAIEPTSAQQGRRNLLNRIESISIFESID